MKQGLKLGGRALTTYVVALLLSLLLLLGIDGDWYWLQAVFNALLFFGMLTMMYADGGTQGEHACTMTASVLRMRDQGQDPSLDLLKKCFTTRAALVCYLTFMLPLALVATANLIAEPYYPPVIIEALPADFQSIPEAAPDADEAEQAALLGDGGPGDGGSSDGESSDGGSIAFNPFNVVARVVFMPMVAAYRPFDANPHGLNLLLLGMALLTPLPAALGYLGGPKLRKKKLADIEKGKRRKMRGLKVHKKPRAARPPKPEV